LYSKVLDPIFSREICGYTFYTKKSSDVECRFDILFSICRLTNTAEILPVNFATEHKQMLSHLYIMINKKYLAIHSNFEKLIISLRTALRIAQVTEYSLDKEQTSYSDSLDALRLSLKGYNIK
jgi:hypothetical protein